MHHDCVEVLVQDGRCGTKSTMHHDNVMVLVPRLQVWDLGGQANLRPSWATYYTQTDCVIMVSHPKELSLRIMCGSGFNDGSGFSYGSGFKYVSGFCPFGSNLTSRQRP